jgi:hypothetical protein
MTGLAPRSPSRTLLLYALLVGMSSIVAVLVGEVALRLIPIPGITYHSFYYDARTGGKYYPHTTLIYRRDGREVRRRVNAWGFPDVEHSVAPEPGTLRIGFFGDSYVEALQVASGDTFVRRIENELNLRINELAGVSNRRGEPVTRVETLGFGMSGRGTLQSWLECQNWMSACDLDYVVYVFVENDPADQIRSLKGSDAIPYPVLAADSFVVDYSFNDVYGYKASWWHRLMQRIKSNSLVVSTLEGRLKLLKNYGLKRRVTEADRTGAAGGGGAPMPPSAWPPALVPEGWALVERVVDAWNLGVETEGRRFVIARVPREEEVAVSLAEQDTWAPRLTTLCDQRGIPLVDPTPYFLPLMHTGEKIYDDHFTPVGHRAFAAAFVNFFVADAKTQ